MTMRQILEHLQSDYAGATGTYLGDAIILIGDQAQTQRSDTKVTVRLVPLPSEDADGYVGRTGWNDRFRVNIRAEYPDAWKGTTRHLDIGEELKQVICDNRRITSADASQQAVLRARRWGYGYDASGEQTLNTVDIVAEWEGDGDTPT